MVSVRGLTATPAGLRPTRTVATTLVAAVTAWAVLPAEGADAAAVAVMAAGASTAMAAVIMVMARWGLFMTSCFLAGRASGVPGHRPALRVIPYVQTPGRAGGLRGLLRDASRSSSCSPRTDPFYIVCTPGRPAQRARAKRKAHAPCRSLIRGSGFEPCHMLTRPDAVRHTSTATQSAGSGRDSQCRTTDLPRRPGPTRTALVRDEEVASRNHGETAAEVDERLHGLSGGHGIRGHVRRVVSDSPM